MRRLAAAAVAAGALVAPASAGAIEQRGENSVGLPVVLHVEGDTVTRYEVSVPAYCVGRKKRRVVRKKRIVRFVDTRGAIVESDGWFHALGRSGRLKAQISGYRGEGGDFMGRFKLLSHKWKRLTCVSPRVYWGVSPPWPG